jgi:hypothetical protein
MIPVRTFSRGAGGGTDMAIWLTKLVNYDESTTYTANLTVEDLGKGHAQGTLRKLSGPVPVEEIDLSGVSRGNEFILAGSNQALGVNFFLTFSPFVFAFTGSVRITVHGGAQVLDLYVITKSTE